MAAVIRPFIVPMIVELPVYVWAESRKQALEIAKRDLTTTPPDTTLQVQDYLQTDARMKVGDYAITGNMRWLAPAGWVATAEVEL